MTVGFSVGAVTDVGSRREANQDQLLALPTLVAVADGMGGHSAGEIASDLAIATVTEQAAAGKIVTVDDIVSAVELANKAVREGSANDAALAGMGTTICILGLVESGSDLAAEGNQATMAVVNVGDSRAYALRGDQVVQLTEDHSLVHSLVKEGRITAEEAETHPQRNIVTRALGVSDTVEVDEFRHQVEPGMRFLLCSDGLTNEVTDSEIARILKEFEEPQEAAQELVNAANRGGGRDNITTVVVDVTIEELAGVHPAIVPNEVKRPEPPAEDERKQRSGWRARFFRS